MSLTYPPNFFLGNELEINRLGFGTLRVTGAGSYRKPLKKDRVTKLLQHAIERGINFIDTGGGYPFISEDMIREALHPYPGNLVIATKVGYQRPGGSWRLDNTPRRMKEALEDSLRKLKVDQIDLYQLHKIDAEVPFDDQIGFMKEAKDKGLIRHIGLSEVSIYQVKQAMKIVPIESVQNIYSYSNRQWEDVLTFCEDNDIAFIPWYPVGMVDVRGRHKLNVISEKYETTAYQVGLAWILHHSPNLLPVPGTANIRHLEENTTAASINLTAEDMTFLDGYTPGHVHYEHFSGTE